MSRQSGQHSWLLYLGLGGCVSLATNTGLEAVEIEGPLEAFPPPVAVDDLFLLDEGMWTEAASRRRQSIERAPQSVEVIEADDLIRLPGGSLPDALRYYPGIEVSQARASQYDVGLRGFNGLAHPRTLTLVDGRSVQAAPIGTVYWVGRYGLSEIERVEVVKGPASVAYGANAFGGVVAISTRSVGDSWAFHMNAASGSDAYGEGDATILGPLSDIFYIKATAGYSVRDDLDGNRGPRASGPTSLTGWTGDKDIVAWRAGVTLGAHLSDDIDLEVDGRLFDTSPWEFAEDLSAGSNDTDRRMANLGVRLVTTWGELDYSREWSRLDYENQRADFQPTRPFLYNQIGFDTVQDVIRGQVNLTFDEHVFSFGGEYFHFDTTSNLWDREGVFTDESTWKEETTTNLAAFAEGQIVVAGDLTFTGGMRIDDHSLVGSDVSPRAAINYSIDPGHFVRASFSTGYRLPTSIESYISEFFFVVDDGLESETITSVELAWQRHTGEWSAGIGGFFNRSNDLLWREPLDESTMSTNYNAWLTALQGGDNQRRPGPFFELTNLDNPLIGYGLEVFGEWRAHDTLELWANATLQRYRYQDNLSLQSDGFTGFDTATNSLQTLFRFDETLPSDVNAPADWKGSVGLTWSPENWIITLAGRLHGPRTFFSFPASYFSSTGEIAVEEVDAYAALDVAVTWRLMAEGGREVWLRGSVTNLIDSEHHESFPYPERALDDDVVDQYTSEIGRQWVIGFGAKF